MIPFTFSELIKVKIVNWLVQINHFQSKLRREISPLLKIQEINSDSLMQFCDREEYNRVERGTK